MFKVSCLCTNIFVFGELKDMFSDIDELILAAVEMQKKKDKNEMETN